MSLLNKALQFAPKNRRTVATASDELIELAVAYSKHEVNQYQIAEVLKISPGNVPSRMGMALKEAVRTGKLVYSK